jgi:hypothetical protein
MRKKKRKRRYWVYAVELDPDLCRTKRVRARNPDAKNDGACVFVGFTSKGPPSRLFEGRGFGAIKREKYRRAARRHLPEWDHKAHTKLEGALSRRDRVVSALRAEGHTVVNGPPPKKYSAYVIELNPRPPKAADGQTAVYVGQTSKTPEERLAEHRAGVRTKVQRFCADARLRPDLCGEYQGELMTQLESLRAERTLADRLRKLGMHVRGGH